MATFTMWACDSLQASLHAWKWAKEAPTDSCTSTLLQGGFGRAPVIDPWFVVWVSGPLNLQLDSRIPAGPVGCFQLQEKDKEVKNSEASAVRTGFSGTGDCRGDCRGAEAGGWPTAPDLDPVPRIHSAASAGQLSPQCPAGGGSLFLLPWLLPAGRFSGEMTSQCLWGCLNSWWSLKPQRGSWSKCRSYDSK